MPDDHIQLSLNLVSLYYTYVPVALGENRVIKRNLSDVFALKYFMENNFFSLKKKLLLTALAECIPKEKSITLIFFLLYKIF